jgi:hypothetical protein
MTPAVFKPAIPAIERTQPYTLDHTATGIHIMSCTYFVPKVARVQLQDPLFLYLSFTFKLHKIRHSFKHFQQKARRFKRIIRQKLFTTTKTVMPSWAVSCVNLILQI